MVAGAGDGPRVAGLTAMGGPQCAERLELASLVLDVLGIHQPSRCGCPVVGDLGADALPDQLPQGDFGQELHGATISALRAD